MFKLGPVQRTLKMLRRRQSLQSIPPPPPPPPPANHWDDGLLICVVLCHPGSSYSCVRLKIPAKTMDELLDMVKSDASEGIIRYVRHLHNVDSVDEQFYEYSLDPELNGPFSSELKGNCGTCAIGSVVYGISSHTVCEGSNGVCHAIHYCDFGKNIPQWNHTKPLPCHRFYPTMVSVNKQVCVIEDPGFWMSKDYCSKRSSLGLLFDPVNVMECCKEIPFSEFHDVDHCHLKVAFIGSKLLVMDKIGEKQYYFDIENWTWIPFNVNGFADHMSSILMNPVSVIEESTLYWLDRRGQIRAFNWDNFSMFVGPVVGFSHDCNLKEFNAEYMTLLHLKDELFCLIWSDGNPRLHLTVIRICLDHTSDTLSNSPHHLTASVLACYCYHLDRPFTIQAAHLL